MVLLLLLLLLEGQEAALVGEHCEARGGRGEVLVKVGLLKGEEWGWQVTI